MEENSPGVERNLFQNVPSTKNKDEILNKENHSPVIHVPNMDDLEYVEGFGKENGNCNAEKVKPKKRKRRRSEKQKERFRQYLIRRQIMQTAEEERRLNELRMFVYQVPGAAPPPVYISESEALPVIPQISSSERLPSPALGLLSPKKDISLRDYKNGFESALAIQYKERVSDILSQGDAHASGCQKQEISVLSLNPFAKPFVPATLRKAEQVLEVQSALGSPVMSVYSAILTGNQNQETVSAPRSAVEPETHEAESLLPASGDSFVPSFEKSSDVLTTEDERCAGNRFDDEHAEITPNNSADDDDLCGISNVYDGSCLLSDIVCLFVALFIILTVVNSFL